MDDQLVNKLATLARLDFSDEECVHLKADLDKMIEFVGKLEELDTDGVAPLFFINPETYVFREDLVKETITKQEAMMNVPVADADYIKVPKVLKR